LFNYFFSGVLSTDCKLDDLFKSFDGLPSLLKVREMGG